MTTSKKKAEPMLENLPGGSTEIDFSTSTVGEQLDPIFSYDEVLVNQIQDQITAKKEEIKTKVYAVSCTEELFAKYEKYMAEDAEWNSTEDLGIVEVNRHIQKIKKDGIKDNVIYMGALPLEASHYFLSKSKGSGLASAEAFLKLFKAFDQSLKDAKEDVTIVKDLEKNLAAAMQGISLG
jgi:hypothetical protein